MLKVRGLSVAYGQHKALEKATLDVRRGEIVVILGANGAGKSSLLKAISGISEGHVDGAIEMQGHNLLDLSPDKIVESGIALVPEGRGVFPDLSVQENLRLGAYSARARENADTNLNRVLSLFPKLQERRRQTVRTMSGGEQQMVAIGRAMMSNPSILTLDEPSLGLSPLLCKDLFQSLKAVRQAGIGILLVEQNAKQSLAIADRGYLIENGRIVHEAKAEELMRDPAVQKAYLGGAAAGGHTAPIAGKSQPAATSTPTPPRPAAQNPSDIAAAALQKFARPAQSTPPPTQVRAPTAPTPPSLHVTKDQPSAPPNSTGAAHSAGGVQAIDINNLVERARATSASGVSSRSGGLAHVPPNQPVAPRAPERFPPSLPELKIPDLSESHDRLRSVLTEIEEAAARARAYRPNRDK